jgi:hypothetical protein
MFIDAYVMNETAKSQYKLSNLDQAILQINKEIVTYANRGLTEVTCIGGYYSTLTEHERSFISIELRNHGYNCRWHNSGKPNCCLHISWKHA